MGESMESLYRRGMISSKQMGRMGKPAILSKTTTNPRKETDFNSKSGRRDQGGIRDRGDAAATGDTIDKNQTMGTPADAGGKPSKGGSVPSKGARPKVAEIDQAEYQKPDWPAGSKVKANKRQVGRVGLGGTEPGLRSSGPQYGGPSSRKFG